MQRLSGAEAKSRADRRLKTDYAKIRSIPTRWMDNDAYGHVNNVSYYSYFDTAVNQELIEAGLLDIDMSQQIALVVESQCRYFAPLVFPDVVQVGLRVARVGKSSVRYELGIFRNDENEAVAEGYFVHVYVDRYSRRADVIPSRTRQFLLSLAKP